LDELLPDCEPELDCGGGRRFDENRRDDSARERQD